MDETTLDWFLGFCNYFLLNPTSVTSSVDDKTNNLEVFCNQRNIGPVSLT